MSTPTSGAIKPLNIYVASSWRNQHQQHVVELLRSASYEVYDFRNPAEGDNGFGWKEVDGFGPPWTPEQIRDALTTPPAERGFGFDMNALLDCDACVLLLPCGRSAHLEAGWAMGAGKPTLTYLPPLPVGEYYEPELMYKMGDGVVVSEGELLESLEMINVNRSLVPTPFEMQVVEYARLRHPGADLARHFRKLGEEFGEFVEAALRLATGGGVFNPGTVEYAALAEVLEDEGADLSLVVAIIMAQCGLSQSKAMRQKLKLNLKRLETGERVPDAPPEA